MAIFKKNTFFLFQLSSKMTDSTDNDRKCMFKDAVKNLECCAEIVIKQLVGKIC